MQTTAKQLKPFQLVTVATPNSARRRVVETVSRPYHVFDTQACQNIPEVIQIRTVPGDSTTSREIATADLEPSRHGKRAYCHVAEVRCGLGFPEDMLRYDNAALYNPDLHEDGEVHPRFGDRRPIRISEATDTDLTVEGIPYVRQPRILVYAVTDRKTPPWTVDRWNSFSCTIKHLHTKKLGD